MLLNAPPLNNKICRNDTKGSKPAFKEYIYSRSLLLLWKEIYFYVLEKYTISGFRRDVHEICALVLYAA
jgi:hypothetical protein